MYIVIIVFIFKVFFEDLFEDFGKDYIEKKVRLKGLYS